MAESRPPITVTVPNCIERSDWLVDAPSVFDVEHDETARLYATNRGVTPSILGDIDPGKPWETIPMGYTTLMLLEKRAVVADGALVRLWPRRYGATDEFRIDSFDAVMAGVGASRLGVGLGHPLGSAIETAKALSQKMNGEPIVVTRTLSNINWH